MSEYGSKWLTPYGEKKLSKREKQLQADSALRLMDDFIDAENGTMRSTVISGGSVSMRSTVALALLRRQMQLGMPVFVLHRGNSRFIQTLCKDGRNAFIPNGRQFLNFDPLTRIQSETVVSILSEIAETRLGCGKKLRSVLKLGLELIAAEGKRCSLKTLCDFRWEDMAEYVQMSDVIDAMYYINRIGAVSESLADAQALFDALQEECLPRAYGEREAIGLGDAVRLNACVCIDIMSDSNLMFMELYFTALKRMKATGRSFMVIVDSLGMPEDKKSSIRELLLSDDSRVPTVCVSADTTTMPGLTSEDFARLVGGETNVVVFSHQSGSSADKWSEYFGEYYHVKRDESIGYSKDNLSILRKTNTRSVTIGEERRRRILPEQVTNLPPGCAIISPGKVYQEGKLFTLISFE